MALDSLVVAPAPWCSLGECGEQYCLVWESRFLRDLGSAMASLLDGLVSMVAQEALKYTILSGRRMVRQKALSLLKGSVFVTSFRSVCACGNIFSVLDLCIVKSRCYC